MSHFTSTSDVSGGGARVCRACGDPLPADAPGSACWRCMAALATGSSAPESAFAGPESDPGVATTGLNSNSSLEKAEPIRLGDYILEEQIAHGGMGIVYRARQCSLARIVALKLLLLGRYSSAESVRRFRREAQSAACLRHPHIVPVYDVGECEGQPYLTMEYVDGRSLAEIMRQGPLTPACAARYALEVAEAIHYAHSQGVLHRDVKPSNVLVDAFDQIRLTDFGLAKKLDGSGDLTLTGEMIGSPNYLSPEQAAGKHAEVGPASDIYGIGALLYELLTGRPPFMAPSLQDTLLHIRDTEPVATTRLNPALPRDLDTIALKCLKKDPARRYSSAAALAEDLQRYLNGEPITARPVSAWERSLKWIRRHRTRAALIATVACSLIALAVGSLWFSFSVERARADTEAANRRLEHNLFVREWNDAEQLLEEGKTIPALTWFARTVRNDASNHIAASRLISLLGDLTISIPAGPPLVHTNAVISADFSMDGRRMVTGGNDGHVRTWSWREASLDRVFPRTFRDPAAVFVPNLDRILVAEENRNSLWSLDGVLDRESSSGGRGMFRWSMSRDGRRAALVSSASEPSLWDPAGPRWLQNLDIGIPRTRVASMSADGRYLVGPIMVSAGEDAHLGLWDIESGRLIWHSKIPANDLLGPIYSVAVSDDIAHVAVGRWGGQVLIWKVDPRAGEGAPASTPTPLWSIQLNESARVETFRFLSRNQRLVFGTFDGGVYLCDLTTGEIMPDRIEHSGAITAVLVSPDETTLASASIDGLVRFWDLRPRRSEPLTITLPNEVWDVAISPDGSWFAAGGDPNAEIRDAHTGVLRHELPMGRLISRVAVSPDGRRVVTCTEQGEIRIWDAATGAPMTSARHLADRIHDLSFSSDGRWVCVGAPSFEARLLSSETGELALPEVRAQSPIVESVLTPDRSRLVSGTTRGEVHFWSVPEMTLLPSSSRHRGIVWTVRSSQDSRLVATASGDQSTLIWDVASARVLREIRSEKAAYVSVFSPDESRILIGSADRTARIRDVATGRQVSETMRHPGGVWFAEYSPDGRFIATGDDTGCARIWDAESGLPLGNWLRSKSSLKRLHFSPDGLQLITASRDHTVRIWPVVAARSRSPSWLPELAEGIAGRRLNHDGLIEPVPFEAWRNTRDRLAGAAPSSTDFYSRWAQWFLVDRLKARNPNPESLAPK